MPENRCDKLFKTAEELEKPEIVQINGKIPEWVRGMFLRTGPAKFDFGNFSLNHWLDGYAMLSKFTIDGDTVKFEKKFLQSDAYTRAIRANRPMITEYGTSKFPDPNKSFFSRLVSAIMPIELSDNNQVSIFQMGKDVFASSETCFFRKIEPSTLATGEKFDTHKCFGTNIACAHPLTDETGATYNIGSTVITGTKYNIIRVPPPASNVSAKDLMKKSQIICSIPSSWTGLMSYSHSFALTKDSRYLVFIEQPYVMNLSKAAMTYLKNPPFQEWLEWKQELRNTFFVYEKATAKIIKTSFISKEPFFFLHAINAYTEENQIVIDINAYPNADYMNSMNLCKLRQGDKSPGSQASCHRYVIPICNNVKDVPENIDLVAVKSDATAIRVGNSIILTPEILTQPGIELPTLNKKFQGKKYSYFYAAGSTSNESHTFSNAICKVDVKNKKTYLWKENEFANPGEPLFIPNPNSKGDEDDGVLISAVTDSRNDASDFLVVLNAKTMKELGRAKFKAHIPTAIHGMFIP